VFLCPWVALAASRPVAVLLVLLAATLPVQ
jgi:hypothetical protein